MADSLEAFPVSNLHQYDITLVFKLRLRNIIKKKLVERAKVGYG